MISLPRTFAVLLGLILFTTACAPASTTEILPGQTMAQVRAAAGEPDENQEFTLPSEPFFGPQERLANLLPAGTQVEEWRYLIEDEVTYVWFAGETGASRETWTVVDTATYPADVVW